MKKIEFQHLGYDKKWSLEKSEAGKKIIKLNRKGRRQFLLSIAGMALLLGYLGAFLVFTSAKGNWVEYVICGAFISVILWVTLHELTPGLIFRINKRLGKIGEELNATLDCYPNQRKVFFQ